MIGATFMHIDKGIDTGKIIHQIRADILIGDGPHSIGNRLIKKMTNVYCEIIASFNNLTEEKQPDISGRLYFTKDFNSKTCGLLYENLYSGVIDNYILKSNKKLFPYIVQNQGLLKLK